MLTSPGARGTSCCPGPDASAQAHFEALSTHSIQDQQRIEASDSLPFEIYRQQYIDPRRLGLSRGAIAPSLAAP